MNKTGFKQYLEAKNLAKRTITYYEKGVGYFFNYLKKDDIQVTKPDILKYLEHLKNKGVQNITRKNNLIALNHYFTFLCEEEQVIKNPCWNLKIRGANKKRLHKIYTPEELIQLADNFYTVFISGFDDSYMKHPTKKERSFLSRHRNYTMLTFLLYQGLTTKELPLINQNDIDLNKAKLTLNNGTATRTLPIQAAQMGTLIHYINNIRPQFLDICGETEKLFFSLSSEQYDKTFSKPLRQLTKQVKSIDRNFINFSQTRTSVITHWIQTEGLRKAQYLAGHKNIKSTELYIQNNLDNLIDDINKLHPF
jgi:site-specific recombinase XerD